jgi:putative membrane protein
MKKTTTIAAVIIVISSLLVFGISAAQSDIERGEEMMKQMMGVSHESMDGFMDSMMGGEGTRSMHAMMGNMAAKGITADDMKPMARFMSACQSRAEGNYFSGMMGGFGNMMGLGIGLGGALLFFGWVIVVVFWILVILAIIALIRWVARQLGGGRGAEGKVALDILKERYAKGEINKEEYEAKKKDLM